MSLQDRLQKYMTDLDREVYIPPILNSSINVLIGVSSF